MYLINYMIVQWWITLYIKINSIRSKVNSLSCNLKHFYLISHTIRNVVSIWLNIVNCLILSIAKHIYFNNLFWNWKSRDRPRPKFHLSPDSHNTVCPELIMTWDSVSSNHGSFLQLKHMVYPFRALGEVSTVISLYFKMTQSFLKRNSLYVDWHKFGHWVKSYDIYCGNSF